MEWSSTTWIICCNKFPILIKHQKKQKNASKARDMTTNLKKKSVPGRTPDLYIWHFVLLKFESQNSHEANMIIFQPTLRESPLKSLYFFFTRFKGRKRCWIIKLDHQVESLRIGVKHIYIYIIKESTLKRIHQLDSPVVLISQTILSPQKIV